MRDNLGVSRGLIVAEAVMMGLASITGRQAAHDLVYAGCREASETGMSLYQVLARMPDVAGPLGLDQLRSLTDPANYLGSAGAMVDRVLRCDPEAPS
jgi:3-carboxy-cis,cis-muconate cycloisomerase